MDEVLMRHRQMKPRLEKRYHPSHADEPESENFDQQLLDKITNLKRDRDKNTEEEVLNLYNNNNNNKNKPTWSNNSNSDDRYLQNSINKPSISFPSNDFQQHQSRQEPVFKQYQPRKMHYVDIDTELDKRGEDAGQMILNARKGLRKANTKNLQEVKTIQKDPTVENKINNFDMDRLLSKNNIWLKDHGTYRGQPTNHTDSQNAKNLLRESKEKLRPAEKYSYYATAPDNNNNNNNTQPLLLKRPERESAEPAITRQGGEPYKRRFPKEHVFEVSDDFRFE